MIQKAIIESIEGNYRAKVRIPKYDKFASDSDGKGLNQLSTGVICTIPGTKVAYSIGDVVLVGFENDELSKPVILGLLYNKSSLDSESESELSSVDTLISSLSDSLTKLESKKNNLFVKYSNDAGVSFTSLFNINDVTVTHKNNSLLYVYSCSNIEINSLSSYLKWDILDDNLNSLFSSFGVETHVYSDGEEILDSQKNNQVITIVDKDSIKYASNKLTVSFTFTCEYSSLDDFNICLYTDKNELGSICGDYLGIYISSSEISSLDPLDYFWIDYTSRFYNILDSDDSLRKRVEEVEETLYGKNKTTDGTDNTLGLNSAIKVNLSSMDVSLKENINISNDEKLEIDTVNDMIYLGNAILQIMPSGNVQIRRA